MAKNITIQLRDVEYSADVTDGDSMFFMSLFLNDTELALLKRRGREAAFSAMKARLEERIEKAPPNVDKKKMTDRVNQEIGEFVFSRINDEGGIRNEVAQRLVEIFPSIPENMVSYSEWKDSSGNLQRQGRIRLDAEEIMQTVTPIMAAFLPESEINSTTEAVVATKNDARVKTLDVLPEADKRSRIEKLKAQLAKAELES